ncbi:MAG TPA: creatininase family protein [Ramlibacter sp.]|uniref:creatininase family protein n=1 Tax=Ramlibacter sp. TaxID=1917967 RepID=UPI002D069F18|nr:creatininase family protein [Ramlibacter sp.]HVZ46230.1 creatininase family protein [Ramlibacter sp.]
MATLPVSAAAAPPAGVRLEDSTWTELRDAMRSGTTTVILPVGGTEQNGPHMALGKHNFRVAAFAERIASQLGNAVVAPVIAYVPEGRISPPTGHMRYPGTISVADDAFRGIVTGAARSFRENGFRDIVLIGDSGDYQPILREAAEQLNREWAREQGKERGRADARVHYIGSYYDASTAGVAQLLKQRGFAAADIGTHAGLADTSLLLAADASRVRTQLLRTPQASSAEMGVHGNPAQASAALGEAGANLVVERAVTAIRESIAQAHRPGGEARRP